MARRSILAVAMLCTAVIGTASVYGQISAVNLHSYAVAPQPLADALKTFALRTGLHLIYPAKLAVGVHSPGARAGLAPKEMLRELLRGTGLKARWLDEQTMSLQLEGNRRPLRSTPADHARSFEAFHGAHAEQTDHAATSRANRRPAGEEDGNQLAAIIITAEKRRELIQNVPVPVTVIRSATLLTTNQLRVSDYSASIPGLALTSGGSADNFLSIRGISTGAGTNPTVGILIDDVPFGSTTSLGARGFAPDLDPSDLSRIEVLRGPQGTLYGASAIGGLLNFVTADPSTMSPSGRIEVTGDGVRHGDGLGYGFDAAANVPITDTLAIRASGYSRIDPGYVDDPALELRGVNRARVSGGFLSALWQVSGHWTAKLTALFQQIKADGSSATSTKSRDAYNSGNLDQAYTLRNANMITHDITFSALSIKGRVGGVDVTSLTGYSIDEYHVDSDVSATIGRALSNTLYGVPGATDIDHADTRKLSQELRFAGALGLQLDWLVGLFYTYEDTPTHDTFYAVNPATLADAGFLFDDPYPTTYMEYATFTDLTWHITGRLDVQLGGRESKNRQSYMEPISGPGVPFLLGLPSPVINPPEHTTENAFTYLLTPRFQLSREWMLYARLASGFRPGGPNPTCIVFSAPCSYQPDKTENYEIGIKGGALQGRLSVDASLYRINWTNIQLAVFSPSTGAVYSANGSSAKSEGLELSIEARPVAGMTLSGWVDAMNAVLTSDLPPTSTVVGSSGERLPNASRFSGHLSIEDNFPIGGTFEGFAGAAVSYVGSRQDSFAAGTASRFFLPAYTKIDVHAGIQHDSWTTTLFVNNATDRRGLLSASRGPFGYFSSYIAPRTIGLSVSKAFP